MLTQKFKQGEVIFKEGTFEDCMYEIKSGTVAIYVHHGQSDEQKLTELNEGRIFGEMAVVEAYARSATAVAETDVELEQIPVEELETYLRESPERILLVMRSLSRRLRELTDECKKAGEVVEIMKSAEAQTQPEKKPEGLVAKIRRFASAYRAAKKSEDRQAESLEALRERERAANGESEDFMPKTLAKGSVLFHEGEQGKCLYEVYWGRVGIFMNYGKPGEKKLTEIAQDGFFGEMGLIDQAPRSATAAVLEDGTMVLAIDKDDLARLMEKNPAKILMILRQLSVRLSRMTDDYMNLCRLIAEMDEAERKHEALRDDLKKELDALETGDSAEKLAAL